MTVDTKFLDDLASPAPTPGGGGASAYAGALAAALASMVGNLTVGKERYAAVEGDVRMSLQRLDDLRARLTALVDEDSRAFAPLAASYRMPATTSEEAAAKESAMQDALKGACDVPLDIMRCCLQVIEECDYLARNGSKMAVSDAGAGAIIAQAALHAASLNVYINAASMNDAELAKRYEADADDLRAWGSTSAHAVSSFVEGALRKETAQG